MLLCHCGQVALGAMVLWDIPCAVFLVPSINDLAMLIHHIIMAFVAYSYFDDPSRLAFVPGLAVRLGSILARFWMLRWSILTLFRSVLARAGRLARRRADL